AQGMFEMQRKIPVAANLEVFYENLALDLAQNLAIRCTNDRVCDRPSIADVCTLLAFVADQPALQNKLSLQSKNVLSRMKKVLSKALKKGRSSEGKVQKLSKTLDEELHAELEELLNGTLNEEKADAFRALVPEQTEHCLAGLGIELKVEFTVETILVGFARLDDRTHKERQDRAHFLYVKTASAPKQL
ncbi:hypothetical protein AKJ16_DCAP26565, partial [Drosera capensis]